jgi:EAL domain-containing protein (putative c-di-GMP-specific phosphodiesterase class I)
MGIDIIAERVDSADVLNHLAELGVKYAQGHYIASPQPVETLRSLIEGSGDGSDRTDSALDLKAG